MKNSRNNNLEDLEKEYWGDYPEGDFVTNLMIKCHQLRKKSLKNFTIEDLRLMIGQNFGLEYLIPIAIEKLKLNILAEGDYYEGDLLSNVLTSDIRYWDNHKQEKEKMLEILNEQRKMIFDLVADKILDRSLLEKIELVIESNEIGGHE